MNEHITQFDDKMQKSINFLKADLSAVRAGRANPGVLDKITVDYYGTPTQINAMAAVSVSEARVLVIQPWDISALKMIEKAIQASDIGINPNNDGKCIRIMFPQLTEERRKDLSKQIKKMGEDGKIAVRAIRRDANEKFKALKKNSEVTEDDLKQLETEMQKVTDKRCEEIDNLIKIKDKEIMEI
ncbi:MAG: ribosome recycling factor [Oscillospiraceae bacterium]